MGEHTGRLLISIAENDERDRDYTYTTMVVHVHDLDKLIHTITRDFHWLCWTVNYSRKR